MRKVYIKSHEENAGKYIYRGYFKAWEALGYEVVNYKNLLDISNDEGFYLMAVDAEINSTNIHVVKKAIKAYVYVQPNTFPMKWGTHPNFVSLCPDDTIKELNVLDNVVLWHWADSFEYHTKWKGIKKLPLAFDSISYQIEEDDKYNFDCCFIGTWAKNGFNEKRKILLDYLGEFKNSNLKCGFFINRNISHEKENLILSSSKIAINIHDAYQQMLGLDTNERTFKSLGLTGILVSDSVRQVNTIFPNVQLAKDPKEMVQIVGDLLLKDKEQIKEMKNYNRNNVLKNHTYIKRVEEMLSFG